MVAVNRPPVHASDPITSHLAALQSDSKRATHMAKVLRAVTEQPALTAEHYGEITGLGRTEAARRLSDLKVEGHVHRTGRITYHGTSQSLWFPTVLPGQIGLPL